MRRTTKNDFPGSLAARSFPELCKPDEHESKCMFATGERWIERWYRERKRQVT
jgi:hypothetical protein